MKLSEKNASNFNKCIQYLWRLQQLTTGTGGGVGCFDGGGVGCFDGGGVDKVGYKEEKCTQI